MRLLALLLLTACGGPGPSREDVEAATGVPVGCWRVLGVDGDSVLYCPDLRPPGP